MRRCVLLAVVSGLVLLQPGVAGAQVARIPTSCDVTAAQKEVQAGARVTFTVTLKNVNDAPVAATADTAVTLTSDSFAAPVQVVVPKGQNSVTTTVEMAKPGIGRVKAATPRWPAAYTIVPVRPANATRVTLPERASSRELLPPPSPPTAPSAAAAAGRSAVMRGASTISRRGLDIARATVPPGAPAPAPSPAPPSAPPSAPPPTPETAAATVALDVQVNPEQVHPRAHVWAADVVVLLLTANGTLAIADRDLPLQLSTRVGQIDPQIATIRAGDSSTSATPIRLRSSQSGDEVVTALSVIARTSREVKFEAPEVASLRVASTPAEVLNDGRTEVTVAVLLQDADRHVTLDTSRDYTIHLDSDLGQFNKSELTIPKGESSAETTFLSRRYGKAAIRASSLGVEGTGTVVFLFPWLMLALSVAGGAGGSIARDQVAKGRRHRTPALVRHLAIGALFGLVFFILAMFGAIGSIPKLSIDLGRIIPLNELGAFVLGFVGGYLGNRFWEGEKEGA